MRILYLSCHEILEFDELKLLHELGHEVFSPGAYVCNENRGDQSLRPSIPGLTYHSEWTEYWAKHDQVHPTVDGKDYLTKEFVDKFDAVIVMHLPRWIINNWPVMKHKRVVWRTIGQSISNVESELHQYRKQGMQIVRYSPMEKQIPGYIGEDALIRFYKDPDEYGPWSGNNKRVITFAQHMKSRDRACNYTFFNEVTNIFPRHLFGPGNEGQDWTSGKVSFDQLKKEMCDNRVYFYTGTHPASYTLNFMEAWMSGIPIVGIGPRYGNATYFKGHNLYEVDSLITTGDTGFISDDKYELQYYIQQLLNNDKLADQISKNGRQEAINVFGKKTIMKQWEEFLQ